MTPTEKLKRVESRISALSRLVDDLKETRKKDQRKIRELIIGRSFRAMMERNAEMVIPFRYIANLTIPDSSTATVRQTIPTTSRGWFFADRITASFRPTAGANAGRYSPLTYADPAIAVAEAGGTTVPDIFEFDWAYSESRTGMERQNDQLTIPGDQLFRRDGDGYMLGGDPWAPKTIITVAVTPRLQLTNAGVCTFVFLGSLCLKTEEEALISWLERKKELGV